jgi:hypothetical protein
VLNPDEGHPGRIMSWRQFAWHAAIALVVTILAATGVYLLIEFLVFDL